MMRSHITRMRPRHGFSLVEVIAVIVILAVIGGVSSSLILSNVASFTDSSVRMQLHGELSVTLDRLVREFREIDADPAAGPPGPPGPHISEAGERAMRWSGVRAVRLAGSDLLLSTDGVREDLLCAGVSEFTLAYFDESNRPLLVGGRVADADRPSIRRIALRLSVTRQGLTETLNTRVFIRAAMTGETP